LPPSVERRSAVAFGVSVHLARFAIILAVVTLVPLVGITGWYTGLAANVACTAFAVWLVTRQGLWRASGFLTPFRSAWALLALAPFVLDATLWALSGGLEVGSPGIALWVLTLALVGVNEELVSRVVVLDRMRRAFAPLAAAAVTGALFGLQHLSLLATTGRDPGDILINVLLSGIAGFALAAYQLRFAWIWPLMLLHAATDFTAIHATVEAPVAWYVAIHLMFVAVGVWLLRRSAALTAGGPGQGAPVTVAPSARASAS
jgi:membrane protease YdiL (CAAX protease family)